jgi:hypothetical protein
MQKVSGIPEQWIEFVQHVVRFFFFGYELFVCLYVNLSVKTGVLFVYVCVFVW